MKATAALLVTIAVAALLFAGFQPPAGERPAIRGEHGSAVLPGGRVVQPLGLQFPTGPGPCGMAVSSNGQTIITANLGPERASLTVIEETSQDQWTLHNVFTTSPANPTSDFHSLSTGIVFAGKRELWLSEGASGRVRLVDTGTGEKKRILDLNGAGTTNSFSAGLAFDPARGILYVLDTAHSRVVIFDIHRNRQIASIAAGVSSGSISLSPDARSLWIGAFGSLSDDSSSSGSGTAMVCHIDVSRPEAPKIMARTGIGTASAREGLDGGAPPAVLATSSAVYVANAREDSIEILDPVSGAVRTSIPIRIPGLEQLRGVLPLGLALDETHGWLLAAEAGINAIGVIDIKSNTVIAHLPAGWFPTAIAVRTLAGVDGPMIIVANAKGRGAGPSSVMEPDSTEFGGAPGRGSVSLFPLPSRADFPKKTGLVLAANGFLPSSDSSAAHPKVHHVVLIVKEGRSFDEILGDLKIGGQQVAGIPRLARFGSNGYANGGKGRFSLQRINITPNQHALAEQFSSSDNFYADFDTSLTGHNWLFSADMPANFQAFPVQEPEAVRLRRHLEQHGISFETFGGAFQKTSPRPHQASGSYPAFDMSIPDQYRASELIAELDAKYVKTGQPFPQLLILTLPNDRTAEPRPGTGYPYTASYVADNDLALGRIVDYLSHSPWWREMAIFVTEDRADDGRDHIDAHRTILLGIGPYFKRAYVSHKNASFSALLKSIFQLLDVPPLDLFDATAADLNTMFSDQPDFAPYKDLPVDPHLFDPEAAKPASLLKQ